MFSIVNEIGNNSHFRTTSIIVASIGIAFFIYVLVAITGYLSFGNAIAGNIVGMCKLSHVPLVIFSQYFLQKRQIALHSAPPSPKQPSSSLSCSHTPFKFTPAGPRSTQSSAQSSNGDPPNGSIPPIHHHQDTRFSYRTQNSIRRAGWTE